MRERLPEFLKRPIINTDATRKVRHILKDKSLNTVCENARCPNKNECYTNQTATFLIMGELCTRNCRYCNIDCARPYALDDLEPFNIAEAVRDLELKYAVLTSVTRDDLPDGGAEHFARCIEKIHDLTPHVKIEILTPDFKGDKKSLDKIIKAKPDVYNHNIETTKEIFKTARPQGDYEMSLKVLKYMKDRGKLTTKSGFMIGLGETYEQIEQTLRDLKNAGVDIVTMGQYIQPSKEHLPVARYYPLGEYDDLQELAKSVGFKHFQIGPLVRSSYNAANFI